MRRHFYFLINLQHRATGMNVVTGLNHILYLHVNGIINIVISFLFSSNRPMSSAKWRVYIETQARGENFLSARVRCCRFFQVTHMVGSSASTVLLRSKFSFSSSFPCLVFSPSPSSGWPRSFSQNSGGRLPLNFFYDLTSVSDGALPIRISSF